MKSLSLFLFLPLLICGLLLGNAALTELVYDSSKTYSKGDAVIPSSTEFTLYTAKTTVPADGLNGPPNTAYWQTAEEYSTELQNTYSGTVSTPPSSDNINTGEISNLGTPTEITTASGLTSPTNEAFVRQQYRDFFGRDADSGGLAYWVGELDAGRKIRGDLSMDFVYSTEYQNNVAPVVRLYFAYFNRLPDTGGLTYWINSYTSGSHSLNQISDSFAGSSEFSSTYGSLDNAGFVNLIYDNLFNRSPDQGGYDYWLGQLDSSAITRGAAMVGYSESDEYKQLMNNRVSIVSYYFGMLRRAPDQGGFDYWVQRLDDGDSAIDLVNGFLYSDEYQGRDFTLTH